MGRRLKTDKFFSTSYSEVPETCNDVRAALDEAAKEIEEYYELDPSDLATLDGAMSRAFCKIRDKATNPLRKAHVGEIKKRMVRYEES